MPQMRRRNPQAKRLRNSAKPLTRAPGQALIIFLALVALLAVSASISVARSTQQVNAYQIAQTQVALNTAKQALIAYAAKVNLNSLCANTATTTCDRPGDLPCPDMNNDGISDPPCRGTNAHVGRLPWKTLGLPDLRDGSGERLWYAVSSRFVGNNDLTSRTMSCTSPTDASGGCLNSDTSGTLTVKNPSGIVVNDGTQTTAAIAVVIAPGTTLTRLDAVMQDRSCTGDSNAANCRQTGFCSSGPTTPLCNPTNYLDIAPTGEDNALFTESSSSGAFITGPIPDSSRVVRLNDVLVAVTYADLMPIVQRRVAQEVMKCLRDYAVDSSGNPNPNGGYGHYPWAVDATNIFPVNASSTFYDTENVRFGHVPDNQWLTKTQWSLRQPPLNYTASNSLYWPSTCTMGGGFGVNPAGWWMNWKAFVFYAVAQGYSPDSATLGCTGLNCLTVNPPSSSNNTQVVVLVAGRVLSGQTRSSTTDLNTPSMYLEGTNPTSDPSGTTNTTYQAAQVGSTFNDIVVYQ